MLGKFYFSDSRTIDGKICHVGRVFEGRVRKGEHFQELHRIRASTNDEVEGRGRFKFETLEICPVDLEIQVIFLPTDQSSNAMLGILAVWN